MRSAVSAPTLYIPEVSRQTALELTQIKDFYLILLLVVGVTDAVGEDERDSCGEVVPIAMRDAGDAPSGALMSRLISSLLLRDTKGGIAHTFIICKHKNFQTCSQTSISSETKHRNLYLILSFNTLPDTFHFGNTKDLDCTRNIYDQACILKQRKFDRCILMKYHYFHLKDLMNEKEF